MEKTLEEINLALRNVVTYLPDSDILCLAEYAAKVPDNGIIVDIGTADGASAIIEALCSKPGVKVYTMDPLVSPHMDERLKELGLQDKVTFIHGKSEDVINQWTGEAIDMLFIDGMHSYTAVAQDIAMWGAYVKEGSSILIHDTLYYENTIGKAANEAIDQGLLEKVKLLEDDLYDSKKVGMLVTKKRKWVNQ